MYILFVRPDDAAATRDDEEEMEMTVLNSVLLACVLMTSSLSCLSGGW